MISHPLSIAEISRHIDLAGAQHITSLGSEEEEINVYCQIFGRRLPGAYVEFLRCFGRSSGEPRFNKDYDFSLRTLISAFSGQPRPSLLPFAVAISDFCPEFLCLGWEDNCDDPEVHGVWDKACERDPEGFIARRFTHWLASCMVETRLISEAKYHYQWSPRLTERYFEYSRIIDVDAAVADIFVANSFVAMFPNHGIPIYIAPGGVFLTYYRPPTRRNFLIRIGAPERGLIEQLRNRMTESLKLIIDVEIL